MNYIQLLFSYFNAPLFATFRVIVVGVDGSDASSDAARLGVESGRADRRGVTRSVELALAQLPDQDPAWSGPGRGNRPHPR